MYVYEKPKKENISIYHMEFKQTIYDINELVDIEKMLKPGDLVLFEGNNQYDVAVYIHRN